MRITLLIASLVNAAGSERSLSLLANSWAQQGRDVTLLTFDHNGSPAYPLHPSIRHLSLGLYSEPDSFFRRVRKIFWRNAVLRRAIRDSRPDVVISFTPTLSVRTILATRWLEIPVIISDRIDPSLYRIGWKWNVLRRLTYPLADMVVCQTRSTLARLQKMTRARGCVIPNLIEAPPESARSGKRPHTKQVLLAMGRLAPEKGFDILLHAFAQIADRHPRWSLKIVGAGSSRNELETLAENLKLKERVDFTGACPEPFTELCQADLFVLSSRYEGFPNALCEAMACGLPVVSFDCPAGPAEIIRHGVDGILVSPGDASALAGALDDLMKDAAKRCRLGSRGPEILQRFPADRTLLLWDELFAGVGNRVTGEKSTASTWSTPPDPEVSEQSVGNRRSGLS